MFTINTIYCTSTHPAVRGKKDLFDMSKDMMASGDQRALGHHFLLLPSVLPARRGSEKEEKGSVGLESAPFEKKKKKSEFALCAEW